MPYDYDGSNIDTVEGYVEIAVCNMNGAMYNTMENSGF